jgi:F-type H+-transporting ATPase subunit a
LGTPGFHFVASVDFNPLLPSQSAPIFTISIGGCDVIVSNHMLVVAAAALLLLACIPVGTRPRRTRPGGASRSRMVPAVPAGLANLIESICVFLREEVARPVMREHTDRYIGFVWTVFFFVLSLNLLGMIPSEQIIALLTGKENHFGGPATANIYVTGGLAAVTFLMTHIYGIRQQGFGRYIINFAPQAPWWIMPLLYFLEIITAFVRPFTLAVRLFANIIAGHILVATFLGLILVFKNYCAAVASVSAVVAVSFLELLVAFIQAFVFTFLSTLYIGFSVSPEH